MHREIRRKMPGAVTLLLLLPLLLSVMLLGANRGLSSQALAAGENPIRVAILYSTNSADAQAYGNLLNANGFDSQVFAVAAPTLDPTPTPTPAHQIMLPFVVSGSGANANKSKPLMASGVPDFSAFDLIVIAGDTGADGVWSPEAGLVESIQDSGLPVVGLGRGGHAFFGKLGLDIGHPNGTVSKADSVKVADFGDSQPFFATPNAISIPGDQMLQLFTVAQNTVAIPLAERLPEGVRVASLTDQTDAFPIVKSGKRYLLWGFSGGPGAFTATGQQLFINALRFQVQNLTIPLRSRSITPSAGIDQDLLDALANTGLPNLHALAQLRRLPTPQEEESLAAAGVTLLTFIDGDTYSVRVDTKLDPNTNAVTDLVRWMGLYLPSDKVDPKVLAGNFEDWADNGDGTVNLLVIFFSDVADSEAETILAKYAKSSTVHSDQTWAVVMGKDQIALLSQEDRVRWMEEGPTPLQPINDVARTRLNVDAAQNPTVSSGSIFYAGLDGSGVNVAIFDTGINTPTFSHPDFAGRLLRTANDTNGHGSHVAGIIGGSGSQSVANCPSGTCTDFQLRGMAPNVGLAPYGGWNAGTMDDAVNNLGIEVSNHSYVMTCGTYNNTARDVDKLVRGDLKNGGTSIPGHMVVWAAANQGTGAQYCTTGTVPDGPDPDSNPDPDPTTGPRGYFSILSPAKNQLVVGAVTRQAATPVRDFSSRGPTWDGRLKPDVVSVGCMNSTDNDSPGYVMKCGTSMASPSVAGVVALMTEQYHISFPTAGRPRPSTLKAVIIQTATDLEHQPAQPGFAEYGWNDPDTGQPVIYHAGPDWSTGYGLVNAQNAVAAIRAGNFVEDAVSPSDLTDDFTLNMPAGRTELKITLAWDDEAGDPSKAITAKQLVNDLDLVVIDPDGVIFRPWVLPALPMAADPTTGVADPIVRNTHVVAASRGVDRRNNVEQVSVTNAAGLKTGNWTIRVRADSLPNNNSQKYSLAGDFRGLNIVEPQTGNVAEAGDPNNPNVILVVVEAVNLLTGASGPSSLQDATAADFSVQIGGTSANIISGLPVGEQFWLNVQPQSGVYSGGSKYDLSVTWTGFGTDTETRAVLFTEREITDRAIVLDHSGSMNDYDKMAAAQNAARLFIDQSLVGDRIAVAGFSTNASTPYGITEVTANPGQPELNAAKSAVNGFTPTNMTAIGKGLLAGQAEVTAAPADFSLVDVLVLLSDGMENVDPKYATPSVKGVIEPTDTIIHTVAVGPASAGHHTLLAQIASDNGGNAYVVTDPNAAAAASVAAPAAANTGLDAWPNTLANRLGDTYKAIAEDVLGENRLFQANGIANPKAGAERWIIDVPEGLNRLTFAVNWSVAGHILKLRAEDPGGNVYEVDQKNPWCRSDVTHETCIIDGKVTPGKWLLSISFVETGADNEYVVWASAKTPVGFQLFVGTPVRDRVVNSPIQLLGFLYQGGKPLVGQNVVVKLYAPTDGAQQTPKLGAAAASSWTLQLFDDGLHGDGQPDDGIYGAVFTGGDRPGPYTVRGMAQGTDINGKPFELYRTTTFNLMPRALYVYDTDQAKGHEVANLLENNGIGVDLVQVNSVPTVNMLRYNLVIVGPDTGVLSNWGTDAAFSAIVQYERPVLGLGEGGYSFFGKLGLNIGWAHGAHGSGTSILWSNATDRIWDYPYEFDLRSVRLLQLYKEASSRVDIFLGNKPVGLQLFGLNDTDQRYTDLVMEGNWWTLWSFDDGPSKMTTTGQELFVNTAHRTLK